MTARPITAGARSAINLLLPEKQRLAAALILAAIDLPAEMGAWGRACSLAAAIGPAKLTVQNMRLGDRRAALEAARDLIGELLADTERPA